MPGDTPVAPLNQQVEAHDFCKIFKNFSAKLSGMSD